MLEGTLIAESIRPGASLDDLRLIVRQITRHAPDGTTPDQPPVWTDILFEVDEKDAEDLARKLADVLDAPGWYADFRSDTETVVVYRGKIFRYPRGDAAARAQAVAHGRAQGVHDHQLDWPL
jgi:hypothetical protein